MQLRNKALKKLKSDILFSSDFGDILVTLKFDVIIYTYLKVIKIVETCALHFNGKFGGTSNIQTHSHKKSCNLTS